MVRNFVRKLRQIRWWEVAALKLIDRLAGADPSTGTRRWTFPTWLLSTMLHLAIIASFATWTVRSTRSLPSEEKMEVGIMLRSETDSSTVYETTEERFEQPNPGETFETPELEKTDDVLRETPVTEATQAVTPDIDLLATAGQSLKEAQPFMPKASTPLGGGRSRTRFFSAEDVGKSFVWVIDRSASMSHRDAMQLAVREILNNLAHLDPKTQFQVIFYHTQWDAIPSPGGSLLQASRANIEKTKDFLSKMTASGGTNHNPALLAAFQLQPEVIYFLTDADMMTDKDVEMLTAKNRQSNPPATIHTVEFGSGPAVAADKPLRQLARENDGTYSYVNLENFSPRSQK